MTAENEATETAVLGTGPATLTVFAVAFEDSLEDSTRGELTGRALSGDVTSFDGDVIAE